MKFFEALADGDDAGAWRPGRLLDQPSLPGRYFVAHHIGACVNSEGKHKFVPGRLVENLTNALPHRSPRWQHTDDQQPASAAHHIAEAEAELGAFDLERGRNHILKALAIATNAEVEIKQAAFDAMTDTRA